MSFSPSPRSSNSSTATLSLFSLPRCSPKRLSTQANLDARAALAGEGRQQRRARRSNGSEVDLVGVEEARRRRQLGAFLPAQLQVHVRRIVVARPRLRVDVVLDEAGQLAGSLVEARVLVEELLHGGQAHQPVGESHGSYFFKKHWDKHHRRSKGNMPGKLEEAIAVSAEERDYFQRGQKKLAKKRRSTEPPPSCDFTGGAR